MRFPKMTPGRALALFGLGCVVAVLLGAFALAHGAEVSSVRSSQYEWQCEAENGDFVSGHTRQDKAFQSCFNQALATGDQFQVRGGTYRVTASGATAPPVDPTPPPDPPIDPDPPPIPPDPSPAGPLVTFGPGTGIVEYPSSITALAQDVYRWEITTTLASLPAAGELYGLASRDQSGQIEKGHLSVWVTDAGLIHARNQDIAGGGPNVTLISDTALIAGTEYLIVVSVDQINGLGLWVNGSLEAGNVVAYGGADNTLGLVVGGLCSRCTADGVAGPDRPADGTVYLEIWDDALALPTPTASLELSWIAPTEYVDGTPLPPADLEGIKVIQTSPGSRQIIATVAGDVAVYEAINLYAGTNYCYVTRAVADGEESDDSNTACKVP